MAQSLVIYEISAWNYVLDVCPDPRTDMGTFDEEHVVPLRAW